MAAAPPPLLAKVQMPERGVFAVRCPLPDVAPGATAVVSLDYGLDIGTVRAVEPHDAARPGARPPAFQLVRVKTAADDAALAANAADAEAMRRAFIRAAQTAAPDLRVPYARLSLDRARLFLRYVSETTHPDLAAATAELARAFGVTASLWQVGPRDEVGLVGALGPCGRPCCCATWQRRYPAGLTAARVRAHGGSTAQLNGVCGRFKCCHAFEGER